MARYECVRCNQVYHVVGGFVDGTDETEHLCKDIRKRLERAEKRVQAILPVVEEAQENYFDGNAREYAEKIVHILTNMNLHTDN